MPSLTLPRTETLRETNHRLRFWLADMTPGNETAAATPEHLGSLLSELLRAGDLLRSQPPVSCGLDLDFEHEVDEYRGHIERLRELMPVIHHQLLAERARIEKQRNRLRSAAEWAHASRQTL